MTMSSSFVTINDDTIKRFRCPSRLIPGAPVWVFALPVFR